jgi:two-component system, NtrC family, sensor histidine kinase HydH
MHILPAIDREKRYLLPFLAILLLGLSLSFLTWQNLRHQRQAVEQHMVLAARAIALGMESSMGWRMRGQRRMEQDVPPPGQFFQELIASSDILFMAMISPSGEMLFSSEDAHDIPPLPGQALDVLQRQKQWHSMIRFKNQDILFYARQTRGRLARHLHDRFLPRSQPFSEHPPYLLLGLNMRDHLAMYHTARNAAVWQTGYVLGTVVLLWIGAMALLRRRAQDRRVLELEHFQDRLLDNLPDGLLTMDGQGRIRGANPAAMRLLDDQHLPGKEWRDLALDQPGEKNVSAGNQAILWSQYTDGGRWLEILLVSLHAGEEQGEQLVLIRDRTEIKKLEDDLQEAERLAAIGRLAASVAHEIRNPLSALRGFAQYFSKKLQGREPEQSYARTMVSEADRLNRVITDLLFLAKPKAPRKAWLHLPAVYQECLALLHADLARHQCEITDAFQAEQVHADQDMLIQCLLNLVLNALQALPESGGRIQIGSRRAEQHVCIFVQDNGHGMAPSIQKKVLEPFFTTRTTGSGLGLAIVHKIIRDHEGYMHIDSTPETGTCVSLFFPV